MIHFLCVVVASSLLYSTQAFVSNNLAASRAPRVKPVSESFGFDFAEDQFENSLRDIAGEANYKNFVASYSPEGLLLGGPSYDVITRLRELKLLTLTAESGLLQALEARGLTLSQVEKLLPLADDLNLLPLLVSNKDLVRNTILPLLVEPAPALLPVLVSILRTSPATFQLLGSAFLGLGLYEEFSGAALLGVPLVLLGLPLVALGTVLSGAVSLPAPRPEPIVSRSESSSFSAPKIFANRPSAKAAPVGDFPRRVRKTVRIK